MGQHHRPLMDPIRDGTDGSQGTVQVGAGESWWDRSGSAWGEDDMTGDDVAVTRGGGYQLGIKPKRQKQSGTNKIRSKANQKTKNSKRKTANEKEKQTMLMMSKMLSLFSHTKKHLRQSKFLFLQLQMKCLKQMKKNNSLVVCYGALHWIKEPPLPQGG